jgi:predicted Rossmann fold nucleotide-binding protein DprA/Smf involved in DNA uptake
MQLIKEGAVPISSAKEILDFYKIKGRILHSVDTNLIKTKKEEHDLEKKIIERIQKESLTADEIARIFEIPVSQIGVTLSMMQLKGLIRQEGLRYYVDF